MGYAVIRYQVRENHLDDNRASIKRVFEELEQAAPQEVRYFVVELENAEFLHIVWTPDDTSSPLPGLAAFQAFTQSHAERRSTPVLRSAGSVVGDYRMLVRAPD